MFGGNDAGDKALLKVVSQRLNRGGTGSQARVSATVQSGTVTLSGTLQYDAQRSPLVKQVARIPGVRRVVDQLRLIPKAVYDSVPAPSPAAAPSPPVEAATAPESSPPQSPCA